MMQAYLPKLDIQDLRVLECLKSFVRLTARNETLEIDFSNEALILLGGEMIVMKDDIPFIMITPGYVLGLKQIMLGLAGHLKCRTRNAQFIRLKKSDLLDPAILNIIQKCNLRC